MTSSSPVSLPWKRCAWASSSGGRSPGRSSSTSVSSSRTLSVSPSANAASSASTRPSLTVRNVMPSVERAARASSAASSASRSRPWPGRPAPRRGGIPSAPGHPRPLAWRRCHRATLVPPEVTTPQKISTTGEVRDASIPWPPMSSNEDTRESASSQRPSSVSPLIGPPRKMPSQTRSPTRRATRAHGPPARGTRRSGRTTRRGRPGCCRPARRRCGSRRQVPSRGTFEQDAAFLQTVSVGNQHGLGRQRLGEHLGQAKRPRRD